MRFFVYICNRKSKILLNKKSKRAGLYTFSFIAYFYKLHICVHKIWFTESKLIQNWSLQLLLQSGIEWLRDIGGKRVEKLVNVQNTKRYCKIGMEFDMYLLQYILSNQLFFSLFYLFF